MHESELRGVEHHARRGDWIARGATDVDALADERVARFAQVNTDLMRTARLESTRHQRRAFEALDDVDVRDRELALLVPALRAAHRSAKTVAAIGHDVRAKGLRLEITV